MFNSGSVGFSLVILSTDKTQVFMKPLKFMSILYMHSIEIKGRRLIVIVPASRRRNLCLKGGCFTCVFRALLYVRA